VITWRDLYFKKDLMIPFAVTELSLRYHLLTLLYAAVLSSRHLPFHLQELIRSGIWTWSRGSGIDHVYSM